VGLGGGGGKGIYAAKGQQPACWVHAAKVWGKEGTGQATRAAQERRSRGEGGSKRGEARARVKSKHLNAVLQSSVKRGLDSVNGPKGGTGRVGRGAPGRH